MARGREEAQGQGGEGRRRPPGTSRTWGGGRGGQAGRRARDGERGSSQPDVQPVRCISPGIQPMPEHHAHHHHHHHAHLYNIHRDAGDLVPLQPPRPPYQPAFHPHSGAACGPAPAAREPRAEPARITASPAARGSGAALAPQVHEPHAAPARGAEGARGDRTWVWDAVPDHFRGKALLLVMEVYGWLSWATSGTTRGRSNGPFDAVPIPRDRGNQEVPPGGWVAQENHKEILLAVIRAGWSDREPTWPAFLEGGPVLPVTDAEANNWVPMGAAHRHHPLALPPEEPAAAAARAPTQAAAQVMF